DKCRYSDTTAIAQGGTGYSARGGLNVPLLSDKLAFRVSGFNRRDAGFVDDPEHGRKDVNSADSYGGRADLLFKASENLTLRLSGLFHQTEGNGDGTVDNAEDASGNL